MSVQDEAEARLYNHTDRLLQGHRRLLADRERNRAFYEALSRTVTGNSAVLDIGSGTGIWAVAAALLGARRVVAIEYEPLLVGVIKALAAENGVSEKIEVVCGDSRAVHLGRDFDIVISETVGHLVFDESIASIMIDARERFLKPDGILIPQSVGLTAAAARLENADENTPAGISALTNSVFQSLALNVPVALTDNSLLKVLSAPESLIITDLRAIVELPDLTDLSAHWELTDAGEINCFAVWAEASLTEGVSIKTSQTTSWMPMIYRIKPFQGAGGDVQFKLRLTSKSHYWTANLKNSSYYEEQSYSPALAAAELLKLSRPFVNIFENPDAASS
jgi:type I protein arginine methyltransferase